MVVSTFNKMSRTRLLGGSAAFGLASFAISNWLQSPPVKCEGYDITEAEKQYRTSSRFPVPAGYCGGTFQIKNDYSSIAQERSVLHMGAQRWPILPAPGEKDPSRDETPWLRMDFTDPSQAYEYCRLVKAYCWEGNVNNGFDIWKNKV